MQFKPAHLIFAAGAFVFAAAAPAHAQSRTWVSGVGDDINPCSRTAPCKTFSGAISKTAAGGEINCLDPGGFGAVTITKSITIDCSGTNGSILAAGTNGININLLVAELTVGIHGAPDTAAHDFSRLDARGLEILEHEILVVVRRVDRHLDLEQIARNHLRPARQLLAVVLHPLHLSAVLVRLHDLRGELVDGAGDAEL